MRRIIRSGENNVGVTRIVAADPCRPPANPHDRGSMDKTILVTGAAGFIGSHAAQKLIERGYRVVGVDNFSDFYDRSWKEMNLKSIKGDKLDVEEIDITSGDEISKLVRLVRPWGIIHLAAMAGVRPSIEQPAYYAKVNVEGTTHLLQAAVKTGVEKFAFASSSSVYGNAKKVPFSEEDPVEEPISPYAATRSGISTSSRSPASDSSPSTARANARTWRSTSSRA
jgi:nucleoside-diphosphate-sugar epimerase